MTPLTDLKAKLAKRWLSHYLPDSLGNPSACFPLRLGLNPPTDKQILQDFAAVKHWVQSYAQLESPSFEIEWVSKRTSLGKNDFPQAIVFQGIENLAKFLNKTAELMLYKRLSNQLMDRFSSLKIFCQKQPAQVLAYDQAWSSLLVFMQWRLAHPNPQLYLRQVPLVAFDSKFLEAHKAVLAECLDLVLPPQQIQSEFNGVRHFCARYGFLDHAEQLQARLLDPNETLQGFKTLSAPFSEWRSFQPHALGIKQVFITENKVNFLAFPNVSHSLILFGKGFGFEHWQQLSWLKNLPIFYWGDLDTHGFAILNQLRHVWPHTQSLLMDEATLLAHSALWGQELKPTRAALTALNPTEQTLYQQLINHHWGKQVRLEQERISYEWLQHALFTL
ncbi:Wadjet anti-phage system protein JetD domain-containing protein [Thiomicrorhabdus aquaedulcis]|uniref:Wadjet anti-phage system protein JetD domain-containing protein n=1 Tax=Thiomicrorhabdus aquaedulcis TaxID=2211106 RepID=UPI000FD8D886|nr:Wadjet anti-phage system protein JetD domain-containing protein [Thiomicrorhabdus aquaedulcis]